MVAREVPKTMKLEVKVPEPMVPPVTKKTVVGAPAGPSRTSTFSNGKLFPASMTCTMPSLKTTALAGEASTRA
jgi:hypothetical protein